MKNLFIFCTFDCSFQFHKETFQQWEKEKGFGIVIDYDLEKINDQKSHFFFIDSIFNYFSMVFDIEQARERYKAKNCKDIVYKLEIVK